MLYVLYMVKVYKINEISFSCDSKYMGEMNCEQEGD
jgi:hypothetical protein